MSFPGTIHITVTCTDCFNGVFCCKGQRRAPRKNDVIVYNASEDSFEFIRGPGLFELHTSTKKRLYRVTNQKIQEKFFPDSPHKLSDKKEDEPLTKKEFEALLNKKNPTPTVLKYDWL